MSADAATVAPTKRGRKAWLIALAVVVAVATITLLTTPPKPEPVKVWFVRATNEFGVKKLVFAGTNGLPRKVTVFAFVVADAKPQWQAPPSVPTSDVGALTEVPPGTKFHFALGAPPKDVPFRVMWWFHDLRPRMTRWERLRERSYDFFFTHGMPALAKPFEFRPDIRFIPSSEIKE